MAKKQKGDGNQTDWTSALVIGFIAVIIVYMAFRQQLAEAWRSVEHTHAQVVSGCIDIGICAWMVPINKHRENTVERIERTLDRVQPQQVQWKWAAKISGATGSYTRFLVLPVLLLMLYHLATRDGNKKQWFKSFDSYIGFARKVFPTVKWGKHMADLPERDREAIWDGVDAAPDWPLRFAERHSLIVARTDESATIDRNKAAAVFIQSLGDRFISMEHLTGKHSLGWVAAALIECIPKDHRKPAIQWASNGHIYNTTVILSLYRAAARFGVVGMARFSRLLRENRALYFALSSVNRGVLGVASPVFVEGAGIFAQWDYENGLVDKNRVRQKQGKQPVQPAVNKVVMAVDAIEQSLRDEPLDAPWAYTGEMMWEAF